MPNKMKLPSMYLTFLSLVLVYSTIAIILMVTIDNGRCTRDVYSYHRSSTINSSLLESQPSSSIRKPRVFGYYFEHMPMTKRTSILSQKRKPMKLPVYWENAVYEHYLTKRKIAKDTESSERQETLQNSAFYDKADHNPMRPYTNLPECIPMHEWQLQSFPTCNLIHEAVDLTQFVATKRDIYANFMDKKSSYGMIELKRLLSNGYFRDTFVVADQGSDDNAPTSASTHPIAFKTLRLKRRYDAWIYDRHRMDALVLDRMTKSNWIVDIYSFCGAAGLYEFGSGDMANEFTLNNDIRGGNDVKYLKRLKYALDVANAITDLHTIESYKKGMYSAVVHADVHMTQFVWVESTQTFKLNDFNRCHFMFWNQTSNNETCPYHYSDYNAGLFRSPEEYAYSLQTEEIDVYSMGNIFYYLLTGTEPFESLREHESSDDIKQMIMNGRKPELSDDILTIKDDPSVTALIQAMHLCHVLDYRKRARAQSVRDFLIQKISEIETEKKMVLNV